MFPDVSVPLSFLPVKGGYHKKVYLIVFLVDYMGTLRMGLAHHKYQVSVYYCYCS